MLNPTVSLRDKWNEPAEIFEFQTQNIYKPFFCCGANCHTILFVIMLTTGIVHPSVYSASNHGLATSQSVPTAVGKPCMDYKVQTL